MIRYRRRYWFFAAALSMLAGYADANAFVHLGGYFVSFMSGNSTRLGVGLAQGSAAVAIAGGLIALFVVGVIVGALVNRDSNERGGAYVLRVVSALLFSSASAATIHAPALAISGLALAMGAMNGVFLRDGEVSIGVTYMTGTLVRMGQRLASALRGGERWGWTPYLLLWAGLVAGATLGAATYAVFGLTALWGACAVAIALSWVFPRLEA